MQDVIDQINQVLSQDESIKLAYLFGSQASGNTGPMSDYDLAIYLDEQDKQKVFDKNLEIRGKLSQTLKSDKVDVVSLDGLDQPELSYQIISQGKLLIDKEPHKILLEPKIMNEYFDFRDSLRRYNLTQD